MKMHVIHVRISSSLHDQLKTLATTRNEPIAEVIRNLLEQGSSTEIAAQCLETITTAIRKTIRAELKGTENRMAKLSAKATKFAGANIHLIELLRVSASSDKNAASASSADRIKEAMAWAARQMKLWNEEDNND
jgi:non-homologous end joining protein Ku